MLDHVIRPAASDAGYATCERADEISTGDAISRAIVSRLYDSTAVVADITNLNANVFYELALRHGFRKPAVILFHPEQPIPFDIQDIGGIPVSVEDLALAMDARDALTKSLEDVVSRPADFSRSPLIQGSTSRTSSSRRRLREMMSLRL